MRDRGRRLWGVIALAAGLVILVGVSGCPEAGLAGQLPPSQYESPNIGTMRHVPRGTFQRDETATNTTRVSAFYMSEHQITRAQFHAIMGADPSETGRSTGMNDPVQNVNWYHAIAFCNKLSIAEDRTPVYSVDGVDWATLVYGDIPSGSRSADWDAATLDMTANGYRLPTEAEWMWAAMGATSGHGYDGRGVYTTGWQKVFAGSRGSNLLGDYAVYWENSGPGGTAAEPRTTRPVGSKLPNELGLYDMSGNAWDMTWDWHATYDSGELTNPTGPDSGTHRVLRGGSWRSNAISCTVAYRLDLIPPFYRYHASGFRVVTR